MNKKRRCPWAKCWWSAVTVPGECSKKFDMTDPNCPMFMDEEKEIEKWRKRDELDEAKR